MEFRNAPLIRGRGRGRNIIRHLLPDPNWLKEKASGRAAQRRLRQVLKGMISPDQLWGPDGWVADPATYKYRNHRG